MLINTKEEIHDLERRNIDLAQSSSMTEISLDDSHDNRKYFINGCIASQTCPICLLIDVYYYLLK